MSEADGRIVHARTAAAYAFCRAIARREAKNFYWAFRVLPRHKSDAMCAVYAFMRRADDIADDESKPLDARRAEMNSWLEAWRAARSSATNGFSSSTDEDLVFLALSDTQRRFNVPDSLLEELVAGTTMDLEERPAGVSQITTTTIAESGTTKMTHYAYATFDDLYRYCYLVASVVGLVCIRIFGYSDPRAENLAEETGVAFQLTNILRDVKEDVERGRVYLPLDLLDEFGETVDELRSLAAGPCHDRARARHAGHAGHSSGEVLPRRGQADSAAGPRQPSRNVGAGDDLSPPAGPHRRAQDGGLRRTHCPLHRREARRSSSWSYNGRMEPRGRVKRASDLRRRAADARPTDVVVVGAGVAGLAAAVALAGDGASVTLLERRAFVGGRAYSYLASHAGRDHRLAARRPGLLHQLFAVD